VSRYVLDNTVTMAWCFAEEATAFTRGLLARLSDLTDSAVVPVLWLYEVVNVVELSRESEHAADNRSDRDGS
jgi:hypothetical protein